MEKGGIKMTKLKEFIVNNIIKRNYKYIGVRIIGVPRFSDKFNNASKEVRQIDRDAEYVSVKIEKQGDHVIEVKKSIKEHNGDPAFEVNGVRQGDVYHTTGRGFLGNIEGIEEVLLVTNNFVFVHNKGIEYEACYTHEEIARMKDYGAYELINKDSLRAQLAS